MSKIPACSKGAKCLSCGNRFRWKKHIVLQAQECSNQNQNHHLLLASLQNYDKNTQTVILKCIGTLPAIASRNNEHSG